MKEQERTFSSRDAALILKDAGIDETFLNRLVSSRAIILARGRTIGRPVCWGPEDIFKAFACRVMLDEYRKKFPNTKAKAGSDLKYIRKFLPGLKFGGYRKFTCMKEWQIVSTEAGKHGIDFGRTQYAFVPESS